MATKAPTSFPTAPDANPVTSRSVAIAPADFRTIAFRVNGTAPLVMNKFSAKAREMMRAKQEAGSTAKKGKTREAKNFDECYEQARHISTQGWDGIPAASFRKALIGACRLVDFKMTLAKIALFVEADGFDADEGTPLVKIISKTGPKKLESLVRLETKVADIRIRPQWTEWGAVLRIRYDGSIFNEQDICNLVMRAGLQCGICEGRPSSESGGCGWGLFEVVKA